jgi:Zn-finger nucleic acid-binding protein
VPDEEALEGLSPSRAWRRQARRTLTISTRGRRPMSENMGARAPQPTAAGLLCPLCRVSLVMSERQGVEIDYCPQCRGVWLDRGELDKILERSAAEIPPPPQAERPSSQPEYRGDHERDRDWHDEYRHHKHKRRSFLHDLFD